MNILYCILIDATVDTIRFTANDMEIAIETVVEGTIEERGLICLDAKMFSEIVRKMPEEDITIEVGSDFRTTISCENSVFHIMTERSSRRWLRRPGWTSNIWNSSWTAAA